METKVKQLTGLGNSIEVATAVAQRFTIRNRDSSDKGLVDVCDRSKAHLVMLYGTSNQGKTYTIRNLIRHYLSRSDTIIIYFKQTIERADKDIILLAEDESLIFKEFTLKSVELVHRIIEMKKEAIMADVSGKANFKPHQASLSKYVIIFDDIQGTVRDMTALNALLSELAKSGRHSDITTILSIQSYKSIHKNIRSQSTLFCCMWPLDDEYKVAVYNEFFSFNISGGLSAFDSLKLPRYSILMKEKGVDDAKSIWLC